MLFCVESTLLTDEAGNAVSAGDVHRISYQTVDAETAAEAVQAFADDHLDATLSRILRVDDRQALATMIRGRSATMLHAYPEEEATWRRLAGA